MFSLKHVTNLKFIPRRSQIDWWPLHRFSNSKQSVDSVAARSYTRPLSEHGLSPSLAIVAMWGPAPLQFWQVKLGFHQKRIWKYDIVMAGLWLSPTPLKKIWGLANWDDDIPNTLKNEKIVLIHQPHGNSRDATGIYGRLQMNWSYCNWMPGGRFIGCEWDLVGIIGSEPLRPWDLNGKNPASIWDFCGDLTYCTFLWYIIIVELI